MPHSLDELLLVVEAVAQEDLRDFIQPIYQATYVDTGAAANRTHDGETILFLGDSCAHAFRTSPRFKWSPSRKDYWCAKRIARVKWIGAVVSRDIPGVECRYGHIWADGKLCERRLYSVATDSADLAEEFYVVWLEPRVAGGYRFSSAYLCSRYDVRRYGKGLKRDIGVQAK